MNLIKEGSRASFFCGQKNTIPGSPQNPHQFSKPSLVKSWKYLFNKLTARPAASQLSKTVLNFRFMNDEINLFPARVNFESFFCCCWLNTVSDAFPRDFQARGVKWTATWFRKWEEKLSGWLPKLDCPVKRGEKKVGSWLMSRFCCIHFFHLN